MTNNGSYARRNKPKIVVSDVDEKRLNSLAVAVAGRMPALADELLAELERARIVAQHAMPSKAVRMGSLLEYSCEDGQTRQVRLVYPGEADIAQGRISILTPVGTALIGLSEGQSIEWTARDDRRHRLTVLAVDNSAPAPG
jgi:regulator of nucleoside diphosphate kinase